MNLKCPCGGQRTVYFDHTKGVVSATCPKCSSTVTA